MAAGAGRAAGTAGGAESGSVRGATRVDDVQARSAPTSSARRRTGEVGAGQRIETVGEVRRSEPAQWDWRFDRLWETLGAAYFTWTAALGRDTPFSSNASTAK